jgi:cardiolipin synthase A/B
MRLLQFPRHANRIEERFVKGHRVLLLRDGREAFPAMLSDIAGARRQILLEMYWFDSDATGRKFAAALSAAAQRGVEVAVKYDSFGSWEADEEIFDEMRAAGVKIVEFNPIKPWRYRFSFDRLSIRNHRKLLVVDATVGFTGGINICDKWAPEEEGGEGWRDDMVRIQGPAVAGLVDCFRRTWVREHGAPLAALGAAQSGRFGDQSVRVLGESFFRQRREIVRAYISNIVRAKKRIWISNSYFVPSSVISRALVRAAGRGVDVRVLLPGKSDIEIVRLASRAMYDKLMDGGVRIFEWTANVLHSKTAVIDGIWSTIGTFNLDYRSLRSNLEVNVSVFDEGFAGVLERSFLRDLENATEVDRYQFSFRPLSEKLAGSLLYRFRALL